MHTQSILRNAVPNLEGNQLVTGALWFVALLTMSGMLRDTTAPGVHFGTKRTLSVLAFVLLYMPLYYPLNPTQYARGGDRQGLGWLKPIFWSGFLHFLQWEARLNLGSNHYPLLRPCPFLALPRPSPPLEGNPKKRGTYSLSEALVALPRKRVACL